MKTAGSEISWQRHPHACGSSSTFSKKEQARISEEQARISDTPLHFRKISNTNDDFNNWNNFHSLNSDMKWALRLLHRESLVSPSGSLYEYPYLYLSHTFHIPITYGSCIQPHLWNQTWYIYISESKMSFAWLSDLCVLSMKCTCHFSPLGHLANWDIFQTQIALDRWIGQEVA